MGHLLPAGQRPSGQPDVLSPVFWRDGAVILLDQRRLPHEEVWTSYDTASEIAGAIVGMEVRGAPAIGIAAAFGIALAARAGGGPESLSAAFAGLGATRPTAVNLHAALERMRLALAAGRDPAAEAQAIWLEDLEACRAIGRHGASLIPDGGTVLTHCNAGALATAGYGTALGVIRAAVAAGGRLRVLCDETRPWLQGARLTVWELRQYALDAGLGERLDVRLIVDGAAGHFLSRGEVAAVVVGADRIARNGDTANKIGTVGLAAAAATFGVPFYVAAPTTTLDPAAATGADIPIEERSADEVTAVAGAARPIAAAGTRAENPVFDVTPARLVTAIVTERGVMRPPYAFGRDRS